MRGFRRSLARLGANSITDATSRSRQRMVNTLTRTHRALIDFRRSDLQTPTALGREGVYDSLQQYDIQTCTL